MQPKISKTLEGIIARSAFNTTKAGMTHSLKDFLTLELLREEGSLAYQLLSSRLKDWELYQVRLRIEREVISAKQQETRSPEEYYRDFTEELLAMPGVARSVSTAHALLAIISDRSTATARVLEMYGVTADSVSGDLQKFAVGDDFRTEVQVHMLDFGEENRNEEKGPAHLLDKFGVNLTRLAREGKIDPIIGREQEIERVVQILSRRKKNNPILIGEAGVGKSAIVEGLALRIARGEVQTIGATTLDEYRENIETDSALERRFQKVVIEPTTPEQTLQILRNIAPHYERHHKVHYTEEALQACVTLTGRYVTDRYFPDKAIDALDEAGSRAHLQSAREPEELRAMKTALSDARRERREAVEALVYEKAASARMREIALRSKLGESRAEWKRSLESNPVEITARHIQEVITAMTGIPAERVSDGEMIRLQTLREHLAKRVVGQQEAVEKISRTIRRSRAGLKDENRPIGVFLFVGPTGVGKTLLAKEVSKWLFDEHRGLIRIDMSEYSEKHNVARLIGSPPGYVGYGEGGQLTEAVRRQPYAVVLFDEIEKAHPEVFNAMLQIFDEGHLTDGSGRKVDFRNTIIIMTSNVGSRAVIQKSVHVGYSTTSKSAVADRTPQSEYRKALEQTFAPEFLNRIDDIILFRTLEIADVERIIELELQGLLNRTKKLGYKVKITEGAKRRLAAMGYESRYGVRSLKRTLMDNVEEPLSSLIIDGKLHEGDTVVVESDKAHGVKLRVA